MAKHKKNNRVKKRRFFNKHQLAFKEAWSQFIHAPLSSVINCLGVAMAMLLMTTLIITLQTFHHTTRAIHSNNQVAIYLKDVEQSSATAFLSELKQNSFIKEATYVSPATALHELSNLSDYQDLFNEVTDNPLPPVILLKFNYENKNKIEQFIQEIKQKPIVAALDYNTNFLGKFASLIKFGNRIILTLTIVLCLGVILIISHAIHKATAKNQKEIDILKLLGATSSYIRRPFLYLGALLGLGSAILTFLALMLFWSLLETPFLEFIKYYQLPEPSLNPQLLLLMVILNLLFGWIGAFLAFYKYAKID